MRGLAVLLVALFVVPPVAAEGGVEWWTWAADGQESLHLEPRTDIIAFDVGVHQGWLHMRLVSGQEEAYDPLDDAFSDTSFTIHAQNTSHHVRVKLQSDEAYLWLDGERLPGAYWGIEDEEREWHWQAWLRLDALFNGTPDAFELRDLDIWSYSLVASDRAQAPDVSAERTAAGYVFESAWAVASWQEIEGPDFAGGASVALDGAGRPHVAYYIYDDARDTERGLYLARVDPLAADGLVDSGDRWVAERVADVAITRDGGRDEQMRTQLAFTDDTPHILYTEDPQTRHVSGTEDSVRYATRLDGRFLVEDPTPGASSAVAPENVPHLAVGAGRTVAAIPVAGEVHIQERRDGTWTRIGVLKDTPTARVAIDAAGRVHAAWAGSQDRNADLYYGVETNGFAPQRVGGGVDYGWTGPETDGSYALAFDADGRPALLWNADERDREQVLAILADGVWQEEVVPLVPGHGNPQYTMRLSLDGQGRLHAGSGYGGADGVAIRVSPGQWVYESTDRFDVWDMEAGPDGRTYFAYTQPHGGTTVALSIRTPGSLVPELEPEAPVVFQANDTPWVPVWLVLTALVACAWAVARRK